ncbi:MAG: efflux RND transporter periplasmic adaptor subunit, partial [Pontibacter sp.]|nr:efflux RND transporter periplasmic adaptor subunit [Pontibacter sp.]
YFLFTLILFILSACSGKQEKTQPVVEDISESVYATGVIKSRGQYQVFPKVSGIVQNILVTEGDLVKQGEPLMRVENEAAQLSTESARIAAEYASLTANEEKLKDLEATINLARTKMQNDSLLLVRQRNLWANNIGTKVELEQKELNYKNAVTVYRSARLRYQDLHKQLDLAARQARKNLEISQSRSDDYTVRSEARGKVYSVLKEEGEMVNPQSPVAVIGDADDFIVELQVDEYDIAKVKPGQRVLLNLDSYKGEVFEAEVYKINPSMNQRTRSFTVEASFTKRPPELYPNLTTEANIVIQSKKDALLIPREYLQEGDYVLKEDEQKVKVKTG